MRAVLTLFRREPALLLGLASALIALAVAFGLHLTKEQTAAIVALVQVVTAILIRSQVSPNQDQTGGGLIGASPPSPRP